MAFGVPSRISQPNNYSVFDLSNPDAMQIPQFQQPGVNTAQTAGTSGAAQQPIDYSQPQTFAPGAGPANLGFAANQPAGTPMPGAATTAPTSTGGVNWNTPPAPANGSSYGPDEISSFLGYYAGQTGINPSVAGDPAYWTRRIGETGGLRPDNVNYWLGLMRRPEGAPEGGNAATASGALGGFVAGGGPAIASKGYTEDPRGKLLFDQLMARAGQGLTVNANDPNIRQQTDAYRNEETRNLRNYLTTAAERGGPTANQEAIRRSANEKVGQNVSGFQAQIIGQEIAARRQEIQAALAGEQGYLSSQQQAELQDELARLGLQEQQYQFGVSTNANESQFARNLAQQAYSGDQSAYLRAAGL